MAAVNLSFFFYFILFIGVRRRVPSYTQGPGKPPMAQYSVLSPHSHTTQCCACPAMLEKAKYSAGESLVHKVPGIDSGLRICQANYSTSLSWLPDPQNSLLIWRKCVGFFLVKLQGFWGSWDQTQVNLMQCKHLTHCTISPSSNFSFWRHFTKEWKH